MTTKSATSAAEWVALDALEPWGQNARQHSDDSTGKLAAGIRRFGFLVPLTAWRSESRIAAGHGRRLAMQAILREDPGFIPRNAPPGVGPGMVPVMFEDFASEAQFKAFAIADNRQAKNAMDDHDLVADVLRELDEDGVEFDGMGFNDSEIQTMIRSVDEFEPDYGEAAPESSTTEVDVDGFDLDKACPRCGFEFNE